jgi:hypothetical protein
VSSCCRALHTTLADMGSTGRRTLPVGHGFATFRKLDANFFFLSITGRSSHVAKLRAEFDTGECGCKNNSLSPISQALVGADIDLRECTPGDLDPHAVSSLFKSYLRERKQSYNITT